MLLLLLPCDKLQKENRKNRERESFLVYVFSVTVEKKIAPDAIVTGVQQDRKRKKKKEQTHTQSLLVYERSSCGEQKLLLMLLLLAYN
jgi:hypothetical protein